MEQVTFNFGSEVVEGPDGKAWVKVKHQCGPLIIELTLPVDTAMQYNDALAKRLTETCAAARRTNLGILVVDPSQMPKLPPLNGKAAP